MEIAIRQSAYFPKQKHFVNVKDGEYSVKLDEGKINYIESDGNYLLFYTDDKVYKSRSTIKKILSELSESTFVQTHRAYIINKKKIEKFSNRNIIIKENIIPVSENYLDIIKQFLV